MKLTGRFPEELAHLRAWDLDHMLAIDAVVREHVGDEGDG